MTHLWLRLPWLWLMGMGQPITYSAPRSSSWVNRGPSPPLSLASSQPCLVQKRKDIHPAVPFQRHTCQTNILSRTYFSNNQTSIRVRWTIFLSPLPLLTSPRSPSTVIPLEIWDCPGNITLDSLGISLSEFSSVIFVIDIQVLSLSSICTSSKPSI